MLYCAELDPLDVVLRVIVADSLAWCADTLGGTWVETFIDSPTKQYAGIGYEWVSEHDNFRSPAPFASWAFDASAWRWVPPLPCPAADATWNEALQCWDLPDAA